MGITGERRTLWNINTLASTCRIAGQVLFLSSKGLDANPDSASWEYDLGC